MPQLTNLDVQFVSLVDRAAVRSPSNPTEPQRFLLWKSERGADPEGGSMTEEELRAALKKAEEERDQAKADLAKAEEAAKTAAKADGGTKPEPAKIDKADLAPEVRELVEKAERDAAKAEKDAATAAERAEKAETLAKAERDQRVEKEFIAKAETEFPHLGDSNELGPRLKRMSETLSKEDYDAHLATLKASNEQIAKGNLFAELGAGGDGRPGNSAGTQDADKLAKAAAEIRKADSSLTQYEAMKLALSQDREAQAAYLNAVR